MVVSENMASQHFKKHSKNFSFVIKEYLDFLVSGTKDWRITTLEMVQSNGKFTWQMCTPVTADKGLL